MNACFIPSEQEIVLADLGQFPKFKPNHKQSIAGQIENHLKKVLETHGKGSPCLLRLPSAMLLANFYQCSALDVLDGLYKLRTKFYDYRMNGLDGDIALYGPITTVSLSKALPQWLYPWESTHSVCENPPIQIFHNVE